MFDGVNTLLRFEETERFFLNLGCTKDCVSVHALLFVIVMEAVNHKLRSEQAVISEKTMYRRNLV